MKSGEHIEYIGGDLRLIVSPEHTFGTDALLLAYFASPRKNDVACDFGTGCGIIPFYWKREGLCCKIYAVDIQKNAYEQLSRSLLLNGIDDIFAFNGDLRALPDDFVRESFDLITMNPPYTREHSGIPSKDESALIARHGVACTFDDICLASSRLLRFGGRICMCIRPERLFELADAMKRHKLEPKRVRFVSQRASLAPWLVLIEGKKGRRPGAVVEPELNIMSGDGQSEEMLRIIGSYKKT